MRKSYAKREISGRRVTRFWGEGKAAKEAKTDIRLKASRLPVIERHCPLVGVSAVVVFVYRLKARRCVYRSLLSYR